MRYSIAPRDKNSFKRSNSKTAEATGDLIGNKIADKITSASKNYVIIIIMMTMQK